MGVGAGGAEVVVVDEFQNVGRAEFGDSAVAVEGIMVRLESFDGTHGARATGRRRVIGGGRAWRFEFSTGFYRANSFDAYICQGEIEIKNGRV